ncbi:hypothetical protein [Planktotalea arctica]|uniref:hypothetical protein n=1 Tax=Planktotalea arctica TaxID=1481893 RepID=UPI00321A8815
MDVILQLGAHRTASTSFQLYLRQSSAALGEQGVGFWGPVRLRGGMMHGVMPDALHGRGPMAFTRAQGRIALNLQRSQQMGLGQIIVSDENLLGKMRHNISSHSLYPSAGERIARMIAAFRGSVRVIHLSTRCLSSYWPSALSFCIPRGLQVPKPERLSALAQQPRNWRDVITDISAAAPQAAIFVSSYERFASRPQALLSGLLGMPAPPLGKQIWRNARPGAQDLARLPLSENELARLTAQTEGTTWQPFSRTQRAMLQERYADDLFWLRAGADGLAHFLEDAAPAQMGYPASQRALSKGQRYDTRQNMARPG